jgi:hypothetical protein
MGLNWPGAFMGGNELPGPEQESARAVIDEFGEAVKIELASRGMPPHASPFFRPFSFIAVRDSSQIMIGISPATGMPQVLWLNRPRDSYQLAAMVDLLQNQQGWPVASVVSLPLPTSPQREIAVQRVAAEHAREMETMNTLGRLGDISHVHHLENDLRRFLADHPEPSRNVFVMMRFANTPQMNQIYESIKSALAELGMTALRADDRDYTGDLWSNIEVYLTGCQYGIAVFEDVEQRDFNPNVSLELGYLMGRGKRTLLLKEKRLPRVPSDVVHRLYKEFDIFDIDASINREIKRWIGIDLGLKF